MAISVTVNRYVKRGDYFQKKELEGGYAGGGGSQPIPQHIHRELSYLVGETDILSKDVTITFNTPFVAMPKGDYKLYRMMPQGTEWVKQNVLHTHPVEAWLTLIDFKLTIHATEALAGVILSYNYTE